MRRTVSTLPGMLATKWNDEGGGHDRNFRESGRFKLTRITVKFTSKELELLSSLASDQLFRREFIDSRLPGSQFNRDDISLGKQLLARLRSSTDRAMRVAPGKNGATILRRSGTALARGAHDAS